MHDLSYVREKLDVVADAVRGRGPIRDRLFNAWVSAGIRLTANDFPAEQRPRYEAIVAKLTQHDGPDGRLRASLDAMDDATAHGIVDEIIALAAWARQS